MGLVLVIAIVELAVCVLAYYLVGRRRGLVTTMAHLLVLDLGWLVGVWARQATLQNVIASLRNLGGAEEMFYSACPAKLAELGWLYRVSSTPIFQWAKDIIPDTVCVFLGARGGQLELWYSDPGWALGGVLGLALISLPAIALFWAGLLAAAGLGYLLPLDDAADRWDAVRCLLGFVIGRNRQYYSASEPLIADGQLATTFPGKIVPPRLGPGVVVVNSHYAVLMSDGPSLTRVGAPRVIFTGRKERPVQVIDLRPHIRLCPVQCVTQDGIAIKTLLFLVFRIDPCGTDAPERNSDGWLYPFSSEAVFAAGRAQKSDRDGKLHLWDDYVFDLVGGMACDAFAQRRFDEVQGTQGREAVRSAIHDKVKAVVGEPGQPGWCGIRVLFVAMSNIEAVSERVAGWRIQEWRAPKEAQAIGQRAFGEAKAALTVGRARAQAEGRLLQALVEQLEAARTMGPEQASSTIILRAVETIEQMVADLPPAEQEAPRAMLSRVKRRVRRTTT